MDFDEFRKKRKEINEKLQKAIDGNTIEALLNHISLLKGIEDVMNKEMEFTFKSRKGNPVMSLYGSKIGLAFAITEFMDHDDDFYGMLNLVCRVWEMKKLKGYQSEGFSHICETKEELDIMREMANKSPEDREKILEQLKK